MKIFDKVEIEKWLISNTGYQCRLRFERGTVIGQLAWVEHKESWCLEGEHAYFVFFDSSEINYVENREDDLEHIVLNPFKDIHG